MSNCLNTVSKGLTQCFRLGNSCTDFSLQRLSSSLKRGLIGANRLTEWGLQKVSAESRKNLPTYALGTAAILGASAYYCGGKWYSIPLSLLSIYSAYFSHKAHTITLAAPGKTTPSKPKTPLTPLETLKAMQKKFPKDPEHEKTAQKQKYTKKIQTLWNENKNDLAPYKAAIGAMGKAIKAGDLAALANIKFDAEPKKPSLVVETPKITPAEALENEMDELFEKITRQYTSTRSILEEALPKLETRKELMTSKGIQKLLGLQDILSAVQRSTFDFTKDNIAAYELCVTAKDVAYGNRKPDDPMLESIIMPLTVLRSPNMAFYKQYQTALETIREKQAKFRNENGIEAELETLLKFIVNPQHDTNVAAIKYSSLLKVPDACISSELETIRKIIHESRPSYHAFPPETVGFVLLCAENEIKKNGVTASNYQTFKSLLERVPEGYGIPFRNVVKESSKYIQAAIEGYEHIRGIQSAASRGFSGFGELDEKHTSPSEQSDMLMGQFVRQRSTHDLWRTT